eukprot:5355838-Amphidinium_carterae.1
MVKKSFKKKSSKMICSSIAQKHLHQLLEHFKLQLCIDRSIYRLCALIVSYASLSVRERPVIKEGPV